MSFRWARRCPRSESAQPFARLTLRVYCSAGILPAASRASRPSHGGGTPPLQPPGRQRYRAYPAIWETGISGTPYLLLRPRNSLLLRRALKKRDRPVSLSLACVSPFFAQAVWMRNANYFVTSLAIPPLGTLGAGFLPVERPAQYRDGHGSDQTIGPHRHLATPAPMRHQLRVDCIVAITEKGLEPAIAPLRNVMGACPAPQRPLSLLAENLENAG